MFIRPPTEFGKRQRKFRRKDRVIHFVKSNNKVSRQSTLKYKNFYINRLSSLFNTSSTFAALTVSTMRYVAADEPSFDRPGPLPR
jgi:hypothetical protein